MTLVVGSPSRAPLAGTRHSSIMGYIGMLEASLALAFIVGLSGGVHCVGMCGGITSALAMGIPSDKRARPGTLWPILLGYNLGRIASYTLAGAIAGAIGAFAIGLTAMHQAQTVLQVIAGVFLIALGLYLGQWWMGLTRVERLGGHLWRRLEPLGRHFLPVRGPLQAIGLGLIWGWLPCGLVYSVLVWSLAAGGPAQGASLMLAFGLGTLPNLLLMGFLGAQLARLLRRRAVRSVAAGAVIALGLWTVASPWLTAAQAPPEPATRSVQSALERPQTGDRRAEPRLGLNAPGVAYIDVGLGSDRSSSR